MGGSTLPRLFHRLCPSEMSQGLKLKSHHTCWISHPLVVTKYRENNSSEEGFILSRLPIAVRWIGSIVLGPSCDEACWYARSMGWRTVAEREDRSRELFILQRNACSWAYSALHPPGSMSLPNYESICPLRRSDPPRFFPEAC